MSRSKVHTFCRICEPGCGLVAEVDDTQILSLQPDREHPVHQGFSCHKGVHYLQLHNDPDRLDRPLKRMNPRSEDPAIFEPVSWDVALQDIARRITDIQQRHGKDALAIYKGNPSAFNGAYSSNAGKLFGGFGTSTTFNAGTQDCSSKFAASEAMYGSSMLHPIPDLLHTDYFLCIGSNPLVSHMSLIHISNPMEKLKAIKRRGGTVLFVNPRKIESSNAETGDVLLIKPDADVYFLAGLLHEIIFHIGYDRDAVAAHANNVDGLVDFVEQYPVERIATVTGIDAAAIRQVARDFVGAPSASIFMSTGVNMGRQGALAYWMLNMISLFTGNLGRRGGNIYSMGIISATQYSKPAPGNPYRSTRFGEIRHVGGALPAALMPDLFADPQQPVRALLSISGNPLLSISGDERLRTAFKNLELIVALDLYRSETAELADYILPATDALEHDDVNILVTMGVALEPYVQYTPALVPPKGERRHDWWILARIQQEMGFPSLLDNGNHNPWEGVEAVLSKIGLSIETLKTLPCQTAVLPAASPDDLFTVAIQTDDGRIDCCPAIFRRGFDALEAHFAALNSESADQLKLITRRTNYMINSWMHNLKVLKHSAHLTNPLWMHVDDATARDLFEGDQVRVSNDHGTVQAVLMYDNALKHGVVAMTHGWGSKSTRGLSVAGRHVGANVNALSPSGPDAFDPLSNQSHMTGINVDVSRWQ